MTTQDPETIRLRKNVIKLCPEMQKQIQLMSKEDLEDLVKTSELDLFNSKKEPKKVSREQMINQLGLIFPDMKQQLPSFDDNDLEEVYQKYKQSQIKKKQQSRRGDRKKKFMENGQINVYEMKKILIDKLPQYRNDIRMLPDEQIRKMFRDLQSKTQNQTKGNLNMNPNPMMQGSFMNSSIDMLMPNSSSNISMMSRLPMRQNQRFQQEQLYDTDSVQGDGLRKRGRPRKIRQGPSGFSYDDAPNYGNMPNIKQTISKPYEYGNDFSMSDFNSNINQFQDNQLPGFMGNIFDSNIGYKAPKVPQPTYEMDYSNQMGQGMSKANMKHQKQKQKQKEKQNYKVKITILIDSSDLQDFDDSSIQQVKKSSVQNSENKDQSGNEKEKEDKKQNNKIEIKPSNKELNVDKELKIRRVNNLARFLENLSKTFDQKKWKIE